MIATYQLRKYFERQCDLPTPVCQSDAWPEFGTALLFHPEIGVYTLYKDADIQSFGEKYIDRLSDPAFTTLHWQVLADSFEAYCNRTTQQNLFEPHRLLNAYALTVVRSLAWVPISPTLDFSICAALAAARCHCCYHGITHASFEDLLPYLQKQHTLFSDLTARASGIPIEL